MNISRGSNAFVITVLLLLLLVQVAVSFGPAILGEPEDVTVAPSTTGPQAFTILCIKSVDSSVAWFFKGRPVDIRNQDFTVTGDGSLYVKNAVKERDEGSYYCLVSSGNRAVRSRTATVKFAYLDSFTTRDKMVSMEEGDFLSIKCMAPDSFPHRTVQWSKEINGEKQPVISSSHLTISETKDLHFAFLKRSDSGVYICTVTNLFILSERKSVERQVSLFVTPATNQFNKPPRVADDFSSPKIALKGEKFVLECIVYGKPVPKIVMKKKGIHTALGNTTGNVNRLVINSFGRDDAGKYRCRASDKAGQSDTKTTVIKMEAKPEWIIKPKDITSVSNSTVTLPCIAFGIPGIRYTWYRNGKLIVPKNRHEFSLGNLTIKDLKPHDNGIYQCFVDNKHGQLHADIKLTVSAIPAGFGLGSKAPQLTQSALMHSSVEIICNPTGEPKPVVRWRFGAAYLQSKGRFRISSNGNLRITNVTKSDSGEYICEASNTLGKASRTGFVNVVEYIVETKNMDETLTAVLGKDIRFMCGVRSVGKIEVTFKWLKFFTHEIVSSSRVRKTRTDIRNSMSSTSDQRGYLKITKVRYGDAGLYSCEIRGNNNKLIARKEVFLKVKGPPNPPTDVTISQGHAEGEHVNVTWILGKANGSPIKKVIIEHTTQFAPTTWNVISNGSEPQKGWVQIALSPHVRYTFRVVAVNDVGKSNASAPSSSFQAPSAAPTKYPLDLKGEGIDASTLKISWQPIPPIHHNGPGFYYIVYHKRTDRKGQPTRDEVRNGSTFFITGTDYYVKYTIQIQAANSIGFGPKSPDVIAFSGEQVPVGAPRDLDVRITSPNSAYATWTGVPDKRETARGKLLGYKVYFWKAPSGQTPYQAEVESTSETSVSLHLQPYTSYRFQVVAYNRMGDGPASNVIGPLTTPESIPDSPRGLSLNIHNQSFIILQWSPPERANGIISDYRVTIEKVPATEMTMSGKTNNSNPRMRLPLLNLQARYRFSVLAINRIGAGPPLVVEFDLTTAPKISPQNVTANFDNQNNEVVLNWRSSLQDIEGFRIFYWSSPRDIHTVDVAKERRRKEIAFGLEKGHIYHFQLAAFKIVHGGHYILGPRSQEVTAGKKNLKARRTKSTGSFTDSPGTLLLCSQLLFIISFHWLQAR